ncbi:MAG TPA: ABC transporter substrate-binding protein [Anaeromyxobacteraceae bacterium]
MKSVLRVAACLALAASTARAEETIKVGVIAPFTGPFADYGKEIEAGIKAWMKLNGDRVAGKRVEVIVRDTTGPLPDVAKRLAQELVVREKVHFLAGFGLTPEAMAVADIATQAKTPMIIMNAATSIITTKSPYIVRVSMTLPQGTAPIATWAWKNGIKKVFTLVSDYAPGIDSETQFKKTFGAAGGQIVDSIRVPLRNPEFAPFLQRIKDARPDAVFIFVPPGEANIGFMKGFVERGLDKAGIKVIGPGDLTEDHTVDAMGDYALGIITSFHYSDAHESPENKAFLKAFYEVAPGLGRPNFMAVGGYDGMAAIYHAAARLGGKIDGDKAVEALKGWKHMSPRGPIYIDPATRDVVQTEYFRKVEKRDGKNYNIEFDSIPNVKDPGKQ